MIQGCGLEGCAAFCDQTQRILAVKTSISSAYPFRMVAHHFRSTFGLFHLSHLVAGCVNMFFFCRKISVLPKASQHYGVLGMPSDSLTWATVATPPSYSPLHRDAGKFATYVRIRTGYKIWFIRVDDGTYLDEKFPDVDLRTQRWESVLLGPGHGL